MEISVELSPSQLKDIEEALSLFSGGRLPSEILNKLKPRISGINRAQFDKVSSSTSYSLRYYGRAKPSGRSVAGGASDRGYGRDTDKFYSDLTSGNFQITGNTLSIYSDLEYAGFQEDLLFDKAYRGEAEEESFFADDEVYLQELESVADLVLREGW